jgi:four helix bundle protein
MATSLEELGVLKDTEIVADAIWRQVVGWEPFSRQVVGEQLARAADSIGANIAEAFGRFHYGEKLQFLYYARGSLFETKYWLNRARKRELMASEVAQDHASRLTDLARQLNKFAKSLKTQRQAGSKTSPIIREPVSNYVTGSHRDLETDLFTDLEIDWLRTDQSPISNL